MKVHTFHQSSTIWLYWIYTIISKNIPLKIDSIQYIDHLFHLHQIFPYNQTIHYTFRLFLALCVSPNNIWLYAIWLHWVYTIIPIISPCTMIPYNILISYFIYILFIPTIRLYTIVFKQFQPPPVQVHTLFNHLLSYSIDFTLLFRKISPCWVIPYNILISYSIYI